MEDLEGFGPPFEFRINRYFDLSYTHRAQKILIRTTKPNTALSHYVQIKLELNAYNVQDVFISLYTITFVV